MRYIEVLEVITSDTKLYLELQITQIITDNTFLIRSKSGLIVGRQCLSLTINFYGLCNYGYQYVTMDMKQKLYFKIESLVYCIKDAM